MAVDVENTGTALEGNGMGDILKALERRKDDGLSSGVTVHGSGLILTGTK